MGDVDVPQPKGFSLEELKGMDSFRKVEPSSIFGVDIEGEFRNFPPQVKAYFGVSSALGGAQLNSWARFGMHLARRPEFSSFSQLANGLSNEEKVCLLRILQIFLLDIGRRGADFAERDMIIEGETLASAGRWVHDMIDTADFETLEAAIRAGVLPRGFGETQEAIVVPEEVGEVEDRRMGVWERVIKYFDRK